MTVSVRTLDDGAWVSVNDGRRAGASEVWVVEWDCPCALAELLVEGVVGTAVDGRTVAARVYGRCIRCGTSGTTGWTPVGRVVDGTFHELAAGAVRS
ncbi:MAG: hypothetical protein ABEJ61_01660 [Haloferacaceae archaeon]